MTRALTYVITLVLLVGIVRSKGYSQSRQENDTNMVSGIIWDAESFQPMPYAHIFTSSTGTFSNGEGRYLIQVFEGETLKVSHLGYVLQESIILENSEYYFFWLKPFINNLDEIIIRPFHSEEEVKAIILQTEIKSSPEKMKARQNLQNINNLYLRGYRAEMNSMDNYLRYMKGPQDVNILSTNPYKGFSGVLRNIRGK